MSEQKISISTVTPVYAGEAYLKKLVQALFELREECQKQNAPYEIAEAIFVNDNSIDDSPEILKELSAKFHWVQVANLSRNFGQHPATIAGVLHSSGDWVVTLDEDLQHEPKVIVELLKKAVAEELDIIYANPIEAVHENKVRDFGSQWFKRFIAKITGNQDVLLFNSFRLIRGPLARAGASVCGHETYYDIALSWFSNRVGSIRTQLKDKRLIEGKKSGYNLRKLISHARKMLVTTQTKLLRFGGFIGLCSLFISCFLGVYFVLRKIFDPSYIEVKGWTSLFISISFFFGLMALMLSIALEYISVILLHAQGKPAFFLIDRKNDLILKKFSTKDEGISYQKQP